MEMGVSTLGSVRCPVASVLAPGAVGAWTSFSEHGPSKIFIFDRFYKVFCSDRGHCIFIGFISVSAHVCSNLYTESMEIPCFE